MEILGSSAVGAAVALRARRMIGANEKASMVGGLGLMAVTYKGRDWIFIVLRCSLSL